MSLLSGLKATPRILPSCPARVRNVAVEEVSTRLILLPSVMIESNRRSGLKKTLLSNIANGLFSMLEVCGELKPFNSRPVAASQTFIELSSRTASHAPSALNARLRLEPFGEEDDEILKV